MVDPILQFTTAMQGFSMTRDLASLRREADRLRMATLALDEENAASSFYKSNFERYQHKYAGQQKKMEEYRRQYARIQEAELKQRQESLKQDPKYRLPSVIMPTGQTVSYTKDEETGNAVLKPISIDEYLSFYTNDEANRSGSKYYKKQTGSAMSPFDLATEYTKSLAYTKDYKPTYERYKRLYEEERSKVTQENELKLAEFYKARGQILSQAAKLYGYKGPTTTERPI